MIHAQMNRAPLEVRQAFARLMDQLTLNPYDSMVGVQPLRTRPNAYTAPFDDALMVYEVQPDYPRIHLLLVVWGT